MNILELAHRVGIHPKWAAGTNGGEYHSECPACGGTDRFFIQPHRQMNKCHGSYCCRQCGINGDTIQFARQFLNYSFKEATDAVNAVITEAIQFPVLTKLHRPSLATLVEPPIQWTEKITELVHQAHKQLLLKEDMLNFLNARGVPLDIVQRYKFGWLDTDQFFPRNNWGLKKEFTPDGKQRKLWVPKGLVIPTSKAPGQVIRVKIRRQDWRKGDKLPKYVAISGSMNGLNIIGDIRQNVMIVVEAELDAYAIHHAAHDFAFVVAVGSNIKNPDNVIDRLATNIKRLIILHDNDIGGQMMLKKWQNYYPHARGYHVPHGKDVGEFIQSDGDIENWLKEIILNRDTVAENKRLLTIDI